MPSMWQAMQNTDWLHCCWLWRFDPLLLYAWFMIISFLRCRLCLTLCIEANVASKIRKRQLAAFLKFSKVLILFFSQLSFRSFPSVQDYIHQTLEECTIRSFSDCLDGNHFKEYVCSLDIVT
jgi:hypothetical protein